MLIILLRKYKEHIRILLYNYVVGAVVFVLKIYFEGTSRKIIVGKPTVTLLLSDGQNIGII